jgi:sugar phosphate isomerase/epimerase
MARLIDPLFKRRRLDLMMKETHPDFVHFEMDTYWVLHPGHDPVEWLRKYEGRWHLMHLKDMKKGVATGDLSGKGDVTTNVPLGAGQMEWAPILKTAEQVGVKFYFIEDESPFAADQIPKSLHFLEKIRW